MTRYQYIVDFLQLRDTIAVNALLLSLMLIAPFGFARWIPERGLQIYTALVVVLVYALAIVGVIHDLTNLQ